MNYSNICLNDSIIRIMNFVLRRFEDPECLLRTIFFDKMPDPLVVVNDCGRL